MLLPFGDLPSQKHTFWSKKYLVWKGDELGLVYITTIAMSRLTCFEASKVDPGLAGV